MNMKSSLIAEITGGKIIGGTGDEIIKGAVIDSRKAAEGYLFVPLKGEKADGHDYIESAAKNGCRVSLSEKDVKAENICLIKTKNNEEALGKIAAYHIKEVAPLKIAVTGSVGKTTTRDMIHAVVKMAGKALKTKGNFNNNIGLPLTVLELEDEKTAVLEMGMDKPGEIDYLSKIVRPDIGVITNIGYSHIEHLGSKDNILAAKAEMLDNLSEGGVMVLNGDDEYLLKLKKRTDKKLVYFGCENKDVEYPITVVDENKGIFESGGFVFSAGLPGKHNIYNASVTVIIGKMLGLSDEKIQKGLDLCEYTEMRLAFYKYNGYTVINDCYNASPDSMRASLRVLAAAEGGRKTAVLGSVAELGNMHDELMYEVGKFAASSGIDCLMTVGAEAGIINKGARDAGFSNEMNFKNNGEAKIYIKANARENDVYLIKGSRMYKMEEISDYLLGKGENK